MNNFDKPTNRHNRPYRLWLAGIALSSFIAVFVVPSTRWFARAQLGMQVGLGATEITYGFYDMGSGMPVMAHSELDARSRILTQHPNDFPLHLAAAMEKVEDAHQANPGSPRSFAAELRKLEPKFPAAPALYAAILRMDMMGFVRIRRPDSSILSGEYSGSGDQSQNPSDPARLVAFDKDAETGERLEPGNAYFPFMRAVGYYAGEREDKAIETLFRAANGRRWDEHIADEVTGKWRLLETETGHRGSLFRTACAAGILFPHYSQLRTLAQRATIHAMQLEQSGRVDEGARIRQALMRLGDMMRAEAAMLIGGLVGNAIVQISISRPGGAPPRKVPPSPAKESGPRESPIANIARQEVTYARFDDLAAYWRRNGHARDIPLARSRVETGMRSREMVSKMVGASVFSDGTLNRIVLVWFAGIFLLGNAIWLMLAGGLASIALYRRSRAGTERMPRSGPYVIALLSVTFLAVCMMLARREWASMTGLLRILIAFRGEGADHETTHMPFTAMISVVPFLIPFLVIVLSAISSVVRRTPLRVGVARGLRSVGIPAACLLALGFSMLCVRAVKMEERVNGAIEQTMRHEGRYLATITGNRWMGVQE